MALTSADLAPFVSLVLMQAPTKFDADALRDALRNAVHLYHAGKHVVDIKLDGKSKSVAMHYQIDTTPAWAVQGQVTNTEHHLVTATQFKDLFGLYFSEGKVRQHVLQVLHAQGFAGCAPIVPLQLEAALLSGGATVLYLSGTHSPVKYKANSKAMYGVELAEALEPFADQTYFYTAARADALVGGKYTLIGFAPYESTLWWKSSPDWTTFEVRVRSLLELLSQTKATKLSKLPILATPLKDLTKLTGVFDVDIDLLWLAENADEELVEEVVEWMDEVTLAIAGPDVNPIRFSASLANVAFANCTIDLGTKVKGVRLKVDCAAVKGHETSPEFAILKKIARHSDMFRLWFESGHALSRRQVFEMRFRDQPFASFEWKNFAGFDVEREKPSPLPLTAIGTTDSLFCWVRKNWATSGLLLCDDSAGEAADFVHLDVGTSTLSLIHVKAADSSSTARHVSVSAFEVVVGQAVKNVRQLVSGDLAQYLAARSNAANATLCWDLATNQQPGRAHFIGETQKVTASWKRRVFAIQPHLLQKNCTRARAVKTSSHGLRFRLLDALLLSAEASIRASGMEFTVIGAI